MFNISNFIHPGGKFILNQLKFRDVGRYIIGAFGIEEEDSAPWTHTNFAINYLNDCEIGKLDKNYKFLKLATNNDNYTIAKKIELSKNWMQYYFKSDKQYLNYITDISDIGSYYNIELDGKIRNYTNMLSASEYNSKLNIDIINILKKSLNNEQFEVPDIEESEYSNNLPLIIKIYK